MTIDEPDPPRNGYPRQGWRYVLALIVSCMCGYALARRVRR